MTEGRDPNIVEREKQLFSGLMRTKTLPMVPDQTPSDIPVEPEGNQLSARNSAKHSPLRQELKEDLLARGMSDNDAEEFLRMI